MKKLTYEQVDEKFKNLVSINVPFSAEIKAIFKAHTTAIVDSINENIENEWLGSTVCFKTDGSLHNTKTGERLIEWRSGDKFICKKDYGNYISISVNDKLYDIL